MLPNLSLQLARLRGKATCTLAPGARVMPGARIINMGDRSDLIGIGANSVVRGDLVVLAHGGRIRLGEWVYVGEGARVWSGCDIDIRDRVLIAHNVDIFDNDTHPIDPVERHRQIQAIYRSGHPRDIRLNDRPLVIEDDVWICAGAAILKGITIGAKAIIAARAVVTRDVEAGTIVAGNPARQVGVVGTGQ